MRDEFGTMLLLCFVWSINAEQAERVIHLVSPSCKVGIYAEGKLNQPRRLQASRPTHMEGGGGGRCSNSTLAPSSGSVRTVTIPTTILESPSVLETVNVLWPTGQYVASPILGSWQCRRL